MMKNLRLGAIGIFFGTVLSLSSAAAAANGPAMIDCSGGTVYDYKFEVYFENGDLANAPIFLTFYKENFAGGFRYIATAKNLKMNMVDRTLTLTGKGKLLQGANLTADPAFEAPFVFKMTLVSERGAYIPEGRLDVIFPEATIDSVIGGTCFIEGSLRDSFRKF